MANEREIRAAIWRRRAERTQREDAEQALGHAERLAAHLRAQGVTAVTWHANGQPPRVYVREQHVSISRGGDVSRTRRGATTWLASAFHRSEHPKLARAFETYREETERILEAEFAAIEAEAPIADEDLRALHREAEIAGDVDQARLCAFALGWAPCSDGMRTEARAECERVIRAAR